MLPPDHRRGRRLLGLVRMHRNFAVALVPFGVGLVLSVRSIGDALAQANTPEGPARLASTALLLATLFYLGSWYFGSELELNAVESIGEEFLTEVPRSTVPLITVTSLALTGLALASAIPLIFGALLLLIKLIELWASWPFHRLVGKATDVVSRDVSPAVELALRAARDYYLERPWVQLSAVVIGIVGACLVVGAVALASPGLYVPGTTAASLGLIAAMLVQEIGTWRWRWRYYRDLEMASNAG